MARHACPQLKKRPTDAALTAPATFASDATISGSDPPSSSVTRLIVLAAPYDTRPFESFRFVGANDGGSGAALLLEIARNLTERPLAYTVRIYFLDGEAPQLAEEPDRTRKGLFGSRSLARDLVEEQQLAKIRLLVVFNRVADADLRIARDLYSHRIYRDEFWRAGARLDALRPTVRQVVVHAAAALETRRPALG